MRASDVVGDLDDVGRVGAVLRRSAAPTGPVGRHCTVDPEHRLTGQAAHLSAHVTTRPSGSIGR
ncbi:hypothetical protein EF294_00650 [Gordonia oryzae]|uniref:Uncharacterized protein n=1 Tax=Gordonia oryzae TaxID=2487349 RepID=A0A3N4HG99_9ACTN|nr:hypothetical protein EF294_00650 [Gordonia oryzae]